MSSPVKILLAITVAGCHVGPPEIPDDEVSQERRAHQSIAQAATRQAELTVEIAHIQALRTETARVLADAQEQHVARLGEIRAEKLDAARYEQMIAAANATSRLQCRLATPEQLSALFRYLAKYEATPARDGAIAKLEPCRREMVKKIELSIAETEEELRDAFALAIEDEYDRDNPYHKGDLVATVSGASLRVRMRGNYGGRARVSQGQVDGWCARTGAFKSITLTNAHGTFTCRPEYIGREARDEVLTEVGLLEPWTPVRAGTVATPRARIVEPDEAGLEPMAQAAAAAMEPIPAEAELVAVTASAKRAEAVVRRVRATAQERTREWRSETQAHARKLTRAGIGLTAAGAASAGLGLYAAGLRAKTQEDGYTMEIVNGKISSATQARFTAQSQGMVAGLAIGIPAIIVGVALLVAGRRRAVAVSRLSAAVGGFILHF